MPEGGTMPLTELDPNQNINGRTSRSSVSTASAAQKDARHHSGPTKGDMVSNASVLGMLRTTTETGDIGALSTVSNRFPRIPRATTRRPSGNNLSRTSSHYSRTASIRSKTSNRSLTEQSNLSVPGSWPVHHHSRHGNQQMQHERHHQHRSGSGPSDIRSLSRNTSGHLNSENQRSYSLTTSLPPIRSLSNQRSATSLRSHDNGSRPRSPRRNPPRLRRPGHRPASPALSDSVGVMQQGTRPMRPGPALRAYTSLPGKQHFYRNGGYHDGFQQPGSLRLYQSLEDFDGHLAAPNSPYEPMLAFEPRPLRPMNPAAPTLLHPQGLHVQGYPRPVQMFKNTPSPLREAYTRFGNHNPATGQPSQLVAAPAQFTPGTGFVQRVKNLLEERASADNPRSNRTPSPRMQSAAHGHASDRPGSSEVRHSTMEPAEYAVELPGEDIATDTADRPNSAFYALQEDKSSGDGSSLQGEESANHTRTISTPNLRGNAATAQSEIYTTDSSTDSPLAAVNFSLKTAIQKGTAPTVSEASQSANDLTEFSAIISPFPSDAAELDRTMDRPFSFPLLSPSKGSPRNQKRQSMPATVNTETMMLDIVNSGQSSGAAHEQMPPCQGSEQIESSFEPHELSARVSDIAPSAPQGTAASAVSTAFVKSLPVIDAPFYSAAIPRPQSDSATRTLHLTSGARDETMDSVSSARPRSEGAALDAFDIPSWAKASLSARQSYAPESDAHESGRSSVSVPGLPAVRPNAPFEAAANSSAKRLSNRDLSFRGSMPPSGPRGSLSPQIPPDGCDPRMSNAKYQNFALPDLTEDSQEDASTTNLRMLGARPHPFRSSGPRGPRGDMRTRSRVSSGQPEPPSSYLPQRKLKDTKGIPSFTFSNTDLTATMNRALGLRSSKSMEDIRKSTQRRGMAAARATRLFTSEDLDSVERIRYRSFFRGLEQEPTPEIPVEVTEQSVPDELIAEIDRISIPSLNGLTIRLSELIPGLQRSSSLPDITKGDDALKTTLAEIRDIGSAARLGSIDTKRNSLVTSMVATHVTRKDTMMTADTKDERTPSRLAMLLLNKDLPPLPSDIRSPRPSIASGSPRAPPLEHDPVSIVAELEGTVPMAFASGSQAGTVHNARAASGDDANNAQFTSSDIASTPNVQRRKQTNDYTSSDGTREFDMTMPPLGRVLDSPAAPRKSKLTHHSLYSDENVRIARSMSPGPHFTANLIPESKFSTTLETETVAKKGKIGSLIRKMGIRPRVDKAGFPIDPDFLHPEERPTDPGDRYPTTGLTPPAGLNIEDNRSFFSDDSSEHQQPRVGTLRKRLTRVKQKRSGSRALSLNETTSETQRAPSVAGHDGSVFGGSQLEPTNTDVMLTMYDQPPRGMSRMEFRTKKMVEKLRTLWFRSGRLIRGLKHQKKQTAGWYEPGAVDSRL